MSSEDDENQFAEDPDVSVEFEIVQQQLRERQHNIRSRLFYIVKGGAAALGGLLMLAPEDKVPVLGKAIGLVGSLCLLADIIQTEIRIQLRRFRR